MRIDILTTFPEFAEALLGWSMVRLAQERGAVQIRVVNLRLYATDRHHTTDDAPYGGGPGMVMKVEPIARALEDLAPGWLDACRRRASPGGGGGSGIMSDMRVALMDPRGELFTQAKAEEWAALPRIVLVCGHYEGVDERVRLHLATDAVSIGDYVLTGGELPALVITDALARLQPGALGSGESAGHDTYSDGLLEHPQYTRPAEFAGWHVPDVLLKGNHAAIEQWRRWKRLHETLDRRPDLLARQPLRMSDRMLLAEPEPGAEDAR